MVAFGAGALITQQPTDHHAEVDAAINRLTTGGRTSLGQAILASLTAIVGEPVALPDPDEPAPTDLGYWPSATIVLLSDGEDTGGPDAVAAAAAGRDAGVHISTVGVGTAEGATIEVDGYQVATALDEELLTEIARDRPAAPTTGPRTRPRSTTIYESLDLRITTEDETGRTDRRCSPRAAVAAPARSAGC